MTVAAVYTRDNHRISMHDPNLADQLWRVAGLERVMQGAEVDGLVPVGCNPNIRFYRCAGAGGTATTRTALKRAGCTCSTWTWRGKEFLKYMLLLLLLLQVHGGAEVWQAHRRQRRH